MHFGYKMLTATRYILDIGGRSGYPRSNLHGKGYQKGITQNRTMNNHERIMAGD
jgi:hypothetical protein